MRRLFARALVLGIVVATAVPARSPAQPQRFQRVSPRTLERKALKPGKLHALPEVLKGTRYTPLDALRTPLVFEANVGQADSAFGFVLRSVGFAAGFSPTGITAAVFQQPKGAEGEAAEYRAKGHAIRLVFRGARQGRITGGKSVAGALNVVRGRDPSRWLKVPAHASLAYDGLYPGVQLTTHAGRGRLAYTFALEPGAPLQSIRIQVLGVSGLRIDGSGKLRMEAPLGAIVQTPPRFFEDGPRGRRELKGRFVRLRSDTYGFAVEDRTPGSRLIVDPEIVFSSYFGGSGTEGTLEGDGGANDLHGQGFDIAVGPSGNIYVVGTTVSPDFPVTAAGSVIGSTDAFVLRLDPTLPPGQQLVYATFLGGASFERGVSVSPREDGSAYVVGCTTSSDFPTSAGVVQPTRASSVGYLARLSAQGTFEIGTLIGSTTDHHPASVVFSKRASEDEGFVYVGGSVAQPRSGSGDAVAGGFQTVHNGGGFDGFVAKLDSELTRLEYLTYLGGTRRDLVMDLGVNDGFAFVTGSTTSFDYPTTELAAQAGHSQAASGVDCGSVSANRRCFDAFVTRLGRSGGTLIYSTYLGGNAEEFGRGLAIAPGNQATLTGAAKPTTGSDTEMFVMRLEAGGENVLWDERLTGSGRDHGEEVVVDALGRAHVVGTVSRDGLSTSETSFHGGAGDIFYSRHAAATGEVEYFTYLGGAGNDRGFAVAAQGASAENFCAFVAGSTTSEDVTTVNPLEGGEANRGGADLLMFTLCDIQGSIDLGSGFTKTVSPSSVVSGQTLTYTITVRNGGDVPVPLTITDTVPGEMTVTGVTGGCSRSGNAVSCSLSAAPGATSITITARAGTQCPRSVTNTATIRVGSRTASASATAQIVCPPPLCPNGVLDPGEQCDSTPGCRANCTLIRCGDGIRDPGEPCDDGNTNNNDACTSQCRTQIPDGGTCSSDGPRCAGDLVCGRRCGFVEECSLGIGPFCIIGDAYWLCSTPDECMPASEATFTSGD